ncbi:MAG: CHAT domain-containing protein, partial [Candidatus Eremiobacteraeota bacterium]|nr:CHAT domain-containing protein [Candidatus Eremiobacteraeota bacterium]
SLLRSGDLARLQSETTPTSGSWTVFGNPDGSLPAAELEAEFIKKLHPESQAFVRKEARETKLRELAADSGVLHLATHGRLNDRNPDQSALLLLDETGRPGGLTRQEIISDLDLRKARLVTLSACETALSGQSGNEVSSLADAFWSKGARAVIGSLWSVPDEATYRLMTTYYQSLASGQTYGSAFRAAQLAMIGDQRTFHPLFWSGFIFWGDFR